MDMHFGKPYQHDYRRPYDAEDRLKKPIVEKDDIMGFIDEGSPQTTANMFGFYYLNRKSIWNSMSIRRWRIPCASWGGSDLRTRSEGL